MLLTQQLQGLGQQVHWVCGPGQAQGCVNGIGRGDDPRTDEALYQLDDAGQRVELGRRGGGRRSGGGRCGCNAQQAADSAANDAERVDCGGGCSGRRKEQVQQLSLLTRHLLRLLHLAQENKKYCCKKLGVFHK